MNFFFRELPSAPMTKMISTAKNEKVTIWSLFPTLGMQCQSKVIQKSHEQRSFPDCLVPSLHNKIPSFQSQVTFLGFLTRVVERHDLSQTLGNQICFDVLTNKIKLILANVSVAHLAHRGRPPAAVRTNNI